ncbi:hypothetical protein PC129_g7493 [Phytophthora cactorum]|uniref:PX domain-containing protein n=3 Tax=Phytophthora cactorum TaxID=29920 RepID=A0A329S667_9STRA|nr:hypothetical protein Pcac1_g23512 [Phytophthora cactorum]KAG2827949.1 hypothetical protein PC112_g8663 [Phytophthora cactorum]KAG2828632.1 hypothetical protein PC111_g8091 [Phytophthora cactorum]KAG2859201.1 hypothetical protein PC113_g9148 [Phytophthora cactorum]KAG2910775.1 hypothetical protein PC114_g9608 [Phytophthora cactorum]
MLSLSCGGSAAPSTPTAFKLMTLPPASKQLAYETFLEKRALTATELQRPPVTRASQLERAIRNYDSLVAQVRPLEQTESRSSTPSTLMEIVRTPDPQTLKVRKTRSMALSNVDLDELELPEMHEALCRVFCQPNLWSPAFASPGDFTIKMSSVFLDRGEICFRLAVMCCCARSICDGSRVKPSSKRQYYVSYVERTQHEIVQLTEALSLQYLGHRLANKMPTHGTRLITTPKQRALNEYGDEVIQFLSFVMQITEIGFNGLVKLTEPVSSNVRVRDFLGLALSFGEQTIVATSSCDARIEGQDGGNRPVLPSAWLDIDVNMSTDASFYGKWYATRRSPRDEAFSRVLGRTYDNGITCGDFGQLMRSNSCINRSGAGKCVRFVDPSYWLDEAPNDGSFTVEISSVTIMDGVAKFAISVLFYSNGELEVTTVDRRYSEFDELATTLEEKVPSLQIRKLLPPKTFFRYLSASFLERRAAYLQQFLARVLRLNFQGVLDQKIPLTAEPRVRDFLKLPAVEWIVVPWSKQSPTPRAAREGFRSNFSLSPTAASEFSPRYNLSPRRNPRCIPADSTPHRYESLMLKRSDSM